MGENKKVVTREDMINNVRELTLQLEDLKATLRAYDRIISRASELKWLADKYGLEDYKMEFDEVIVKAIDDKKRLRKIIEKFEYDIQNLKKKVGSFDIW